MNKKLKIALRDAKNVLFGRYALIKEYQDIVVAVEHAMSAADKDPKRTEALKKDWQKLTDFELVSDGKILKAKGFNEYSASRKELIEKIDYGYQVMVRYNIQFNAVNLAYSNQKTR